MSTLTLRETFNLLHTSYLRQHGYGEQVRRKAVLVAVKNTQIIWREQWKEK